MENESQKPEIVTEEIKQNPVEAPHPPESENANPSVGFLGASSPQSETKPKPKNVVWILLLVVLLVIAGGLVFFTWFANQNLQPKSPVSPLPSSGEQTLIEPTPNVDQITAELESIGTSDEIGEIETDLKNTNLDLFDQELEAIENELATESAN